jgi:predicted DNA-binding transcriptional regulator AlpA
MAARQLLTIAEAAKYLSMSRSWLYDHSGRKYPRVPVIRLGSCLRYDMAALDRFLEEQEVLSARKRA